VVGEDTISMIAKQHESCTKTSIYAKVDMYLGLALPIAWGILFIGANAMEHFAHVAGGHEEEEKARQVAHALVIVSIGNKLEDL